MSERRPTVAIAHASFMGGGGEAVALWGIEAIARSYDVTLITLLPLDLNAIDQFYGTSLGTHKFRVISLLPRNSITRKAAESGWLFTLRQQFLGWRVRRISANFDLVVSTFNELDVGRPGVQYIHAPLFSAYNSEARRLLRYPDSLLRRGWKYACAVAFGASEQRLRKNLSVTNSEWTASLLRKTCRIPARVLYPPVCAGQALSRWADRVDGFLCVARFVREKRLELAIQAIERVRSMGFDVTLHIVGHAQDPRYFSSLLEIQKSRSWLSFDRDVSRSALIELLQKYKYGIHPREAEQFGIGVAEMAASGCVPFVPAIGGQAEIVGRDSRLLFTSVEDAAEKIACVLSSAEVQESVRRKVASLADNFSAGRFMERFRQLVDEALKTDSIHFNHSRRAQAVAE